MQPTRKVIPLRMRINDMPISPQKTAPKWLMPLIMKALKYLSKFDNTSYTRHAIMETVTYDDQKIFDAIFEQYIELERRGEKPDIIVIGHKDWYKLTKRAATDSLAFDIRGQYSRNGRPQFADMTVYVDPTIDGFLCLPEMRDHHATY